MILVLTDRYDTHADAVTEILEGHGQPFFRMNLDVESLQSSAVTLEGSTWRLRSRDGQLSSDAVCCVWLRRAFVELSLEEQLDQSTDFQIWRNEWNRTLSGLHLALKRVPWMNPVRKAYRAENKFLQLKIARELGLLIPDTIVSNDRVCLDAFARSRRSVVLKPMAQEFYRTSDGQYKSFYVNLLSVEDLASFGDSSENPICLQEYIDKAYEVRYTVVGHKHFACSIESQRSDVTRVDWRRYDIPNTPHYPMEPPSDVRSKVDRLMERLQLCFGALDFIVAPDGRWYFLEVNPMGQWLWIEDLTGMPISRGVAEWLEDHCQYAEKGR